jgi:HAE1 family hydrophobic/amphiphilic exporter-1
MNGLSLLHLALLGALIILLARRLPSFALNRPITLLMILISLILFGVVALVELPVELMPNVAYGNVTIFIDVRGGMPPPDVERLVAKPVEEAMGSVSHLRNLLSSSKKDRAIVTLEFEPGTDMDLAAMEVREKFLRVKPKLPPEIEKPIIARYEEADTPIYIAALTSDRLTPEALRPLVDSDLKEKLMRVSGVANVEVGGGRERKIIVDIDRGRLASIGVPIKKVVAVLEQNNLNLKTGEVSGAPTLVFGIRTIGAFRSLEDIRNMTVAVAKNGAHVRVRDIAEVKDSFLESENFSRLNARSAVTVYIQKESTANTVRVANAIEKEIDHFRSRLPEGVDMVTISNQKKAIVSAIDSVRLTLLHGIVLVVLVLPLFLAKTAFSRAATGSLLALVTFMLVVFDLLRWPMAVTLWPVVMVFLCVMALAWRRPDLRTSFVVALSIPVSVLMTLALMAIEGLSVNVMSLSGLILGIGLLVDNAVVVMEAYDRIVAAAPELSLREAMLRAADDMVGPMVGGTLTIVVVFLPFSLLQKQTQILFAGISFVVTASLFSSLFVALTLVPALGSLIHPDAALRDEWDKELAMEWERFKTGALYQKVEKLIARVNSFIPTVVSVDVPPLEIPAGCRPGSKEVSNPKNGWAMAYSLPGIRMDLAVAALILLAAGHFFLHMPWLQGLFVLCAVTVVSAGLPLIFRYRQNLRMALEHRRQVLFLVGGVFAFAVIIFLFSLPKDFMASSEQNEFVIFVELDTGVRLDISNQVVGEVEKAVRDFPGTRADIKHVSSKVEGWSSKIYVTLNDLSERSLSTQQVINRLRPVVDKAVSKYASDYKAFSYFSEPRSGQELIVEVFGYEYDLMAKEAMDIAGRMGKMAGLSDVKIRYRPGRPELSIFIDPVRASLFGLDTREIAESLHAQMRGLRATTFFDQAQEIETVVRVRPDQHETIEQLKTLMISLPNGESVPLEQVAIIQGDLSPSEVWHRNRSRMIQVSANLGTTSLETAATRVRQALQKISFPPEYYAEIGGSYAELTAANHDFWKALLLTAFLVFMVMACQFESYAQPLVIMGTVLLSMIGAVAALCLCQTTVTLGVSVGLLMLGGIVVNNGIMLMDRLNSLRRAHPEESTSALLEQAGRERIRPIFMTKITTLLGLIPMAMDRSESAALWSPLAITVVGGLISSSLLTLFVIPCLSLGLEDLRELIGRHAKWPAAAKSAPEAVV